MEGFSDVKGHCPLLLGSQLRHMQRIDGHSQGFPYILLGKRVSDPSCWLSRCVSNCQSPLPWVGSRNDHGVAGWCLSSALPVLDSRLCSCSQCALVLSSQGLRVNWVLSPSNIVFDTGIQPTSIHAVGFPSIRTLYINNSHHSNHSSLSKIPIPSASMSFPHLVLSNNLVTCPSCLQAIQMPTGLSRNITL